MGLQTHKERICKNTELLLNLREAGVSILIAREKRGLAMEESRRFERKEMIDLSFVQDGQLVGSVLDLSPAGARVTRVGGLEKGDEVSFFIRFAEWTHFPDIEIEGAVVWVSNTEAGISFTNFDTLDLDTLNNYYRLLAEKKRES